MIAKVFVEITNRCNLSCPFCPPTRRVADSMDRERFASILERLSGHAKQLYFHLKGEPLLHPLLGDFLAMAGQAGFRVNITTNGTLLESRGEVLLEAPALKKLSVSLQSHASIQRVPTAADSAAAAGSPVDAGSTSTAGSPVARYLEGVFRFLDRRQGQAAFPVSLRLWSLSGGRLPIESQELVSLLAARYPALPAALEKLLEKGHTGFPQSTGEEKRSGGLPGIALEEGVYLNLAEEFTWPEPSPADSTVATTEAALAAQEAATASAAPMAYQAAIPAHGHCHGLRNQIGVLVDGSVVPCCLDAEGTISLGNILEEPLEAILASPRARALREGFSRGLLVEDLCRNCGYRTLNEGYWRGPKNGE